jgi:uncharacterized protein (UPF0335 family)
MNVGIGHNGPPEEEAQPTIAVERLASFIERIERLNEERKDLGADIRDIFSEVKSAGFDVKVVRKILALRKLDPDDVEEEEILLDVYRSALGMDA